MKLFKTYSMIITAILWTLTAIYSPVFIGASIVSSFITLELILTKN